MDNHVDNKSVGFDVDAPFGGNSSQPPQVSKSKYQNRRQDQSGHSATLRHDSSSRKPPKANRKGRNVEDSEEVVEGQLANQKAEYGSVHLPERKKLNFNHLLNFHFTPRESNRVSTVPSHVSKTCRYKHMHDTFIKANCQFMVAFGEDIEYHVDILPNWQSIQQIIIRTDGGTPGCPICLSVPFAAKITKCGHIFCWACILRYFSYSDGRSQPCPICFKAITSNELRSVVASPLFEYHAGDMLKMQFMCKKKNSISECMPVASKVGENEEVWERNFHKMLRLQPAQIQSEILEREEAELKLQMSKTEESLEIEFVVAAMTELNTRKRVLKETEAANIVQQPKNQLRKSLSLEVVGSRAQQQNQSVEAHGGEFAIPSDATEDYCYFFQAVDGANNFMCSLNMAMLWKNFGQVPQAWPQTLVLRILEIEYLTVTPELRKRLRFLSHVPLNSSVQIMEFELVPIVSRDVITEFHPQLAERKRRRSERIRAEKRRERQFEEAERRANQQPHKPKIESLLDFPQYAPFQDEASALEAAMKASLADSNPPLTRTSESDSSTGRPSFYEVTKDDQFPEIPTSPTLSFAQALNKPKSRTWKRSPTFPVTTRTPVPGPSTSIVQTTLRESTFRESVQEGIESALASFTANPENRQATSCPKKGRKKGTVLFATGMGMGNN